MRTLKKYNRDIGWYSRLCFHMACHYTHFSMGNENKVIRSFRFEVSLLSNVQTKIIICNSKCMVCLRCEYVSELFCDFDQSIYEQSVI